MKIHWGRPIPGWILFSMLILVLLCINIFPPGTKPLSPYAMENVTGIANESLLNDSLPYYRYKQIEDSLNYINYKAEYFSNAGESSELLLGYLGVGTYGKGDKKSSFLIIQGYTLSDFARVENKKANTLLYYPVWDNTYENYRNGHLESKAINLKYRIDEKTKEGKVYLPVGNGFSSFLKILFYIIALITVLTCFYVILYIPVRLLYQLAKGKAFTEENIGSLYLTGWCLVGFSLMASLLPIIAHLLIQSQIPQEIQFSYYAALLKPWKTLVAGLGVLLLAKAFLQGLNLKEEQALTI